jgi:sortase A
MGRPLGNYGWSLRPTLRAVRRPAFLRNTIRRLGTLLCLAGVLVLAWTLMVWFWQDPFTALYTRYEQHQLTRAFARELADPRNRLPALRRASTDAEERAVAAGAARYRRTTHPGQAIGRIIVPRLGLNMILVEGTDHDSLTKGPGRDIRTFMPGQKQLVYIAGHRTTYLAPFSHIDALRKGDLVRLEMPYATFIYRITGHRIVTADDISVLRSHGHEVVELQACHPRFFATHRYIAYALPVRVEPRGGRPYVPR